MVAVIRRNIQKGIDPLDKVTLLPDKPEEPKKEPDEPDPASVTPT
jgi:hypothetical protein